MPSSEENDRSISLKVHEWLAIALVIGTVMFLAIITSNSGNKVDIQMEARGKGRHDNFDVLVKGAVDYPGVYHLRSEIPMKEMLALAGVRQDADLRRYAMEGYIKKGRTLTVPIRKTLTVFVEGAAVRKGPHKFPKGTKVQDLLSLIELEEDADVAVLQKKRLLKDGEIIVIPSL